jgi:transposase
MQAVVAGERDPRKLAELSHLRIQASRREIGKSLEGNWRQELLFVLQQEIEMYDTYQRRVAESDQQQQRPLQSGGRSLAVQRNPGSQHENENERQGYSHDDPRVVPVNAI